MPLINELAEYVSRAAARREESHAVFLIEDALNDMRERVQTEAELTRTLEEARSRALQLENALHSAVLTMVRVLEMNGERRPSRQVIVDRLMQFAHELPCETSACLEAQSALDEYRRRRAELQASVSASGDQFAQSNASDRLWHMPLPSERYDLEQLEARILATMSDPIHTPVRPAPPLGRVQPTEVTVPPDEEV